MTTRESESVEQYSVVETVNASSHRVLRRARRSVDGSTVILKSIGRNETGHDRRTELERELETLRQLAFPLILRACDVCEVDGQAVLVLEDFAGQALSIPEHGLEIGLCLRFATQAAEALGAVHEHGLIHNDVQPENLLVNPETGQLKLIGFNVASRDTPAEAGKDIFGVPAYAAPERTGRMNRRPDRRADYYSLGVTLFQMLTGRLPLIATDALGWAHAHLSKQAPLASDVKSGIPVVLAALVARLLAKDPDQRYQSMFGLVSDLKLCEEKWTEAQSIPDFALGEYDISQEFAVSDVLVGRDAELSATLAVVDQVRAGATRLVLMSGAPGVGKSALLEELAGREPNFLSCAFDQHAANVPYSGLSLALRGLVAQLLSQSEAALAEFRQRIVAALGANAVIVTDLVPDLTRILGPQLAVAQLNPLETQQRLQHVLAEFVGVCACAEQPLLLILDDGHWIDSPTSEVLAAILSSPDLRHFMVLTACRDGELSPIHPLVRLKESVQHRAPECVVTLELQPLDSKAACQLVASTLRSGADEVLELSALVMSKTDGNPFFIGELLTSFHRQGILKLDLEHGCWRHDLGRAKTCQVSDNVGMLMAERLARIPAEAADLLSAAACFGSRFEVSALAEVAQLAPAVATSLIWQAVSERLLIPLELDGGPSQQSASKIALEARPNSFAFQHARVQQAAAARLADGKRVSLHWRIGRWLQSQAHGDGAPEQIFEILRHLNLARGTLTDPSARLELAQLNLQASERAGQAAAFRIAEAHAQVAVELTEAAGRSRFPPLTFRIFFARAEAVYLVGGGPQAEALCGELTLLAPDALSRARVHVLKTRILEHQGRLLEAIAEIRAGLSVLGVRLPESAEEIGEGIGQGIAKMQAHLASTSVEDLADLPEAENLETRMVFSLLQQVIPPAIQTNPRLFILAELIMFDLALRHGVSSASCKNFVDCGIIQAGILGNHDVAYRLGQVAIEMLERYAPTPLESSVAFVFAAFVSHWKVHYQEGFDAFDRAEKAGLALGDLQHVAYALAHRTQRSLLTGKSLADCQKELAAAQAHLARIGASGQMVGTLVAERAIARLLGHDGAAEAVAKADAEATATVLGSKNAQWAYSYGQAQVMTSFILGDFEAAHRWQAFTKPYSLAAASLFSVPDYHLFEALLAVHCYPDASLELRVEQLQTIDQNLQKLDIWAKACPENFAHKYHLLAAERARVLREPLPVVLAGYRKAIQMAGEGFPQLRALAYELEAALWHSLEDPRHARTCVEAAHRLYGGWGATAKLESLRSKYPAWLAGAASSQGPQANTGAPHSSQQRAGSLDVASILKATQSISSEVQPLKLFSALMGTLIESAGAQRGCLILRDEDDEQYYVEARADIDRVAPNSADREPLETAANLCTAVVRYVLRSREDVTLDDAFTIGGFRADPYIKQQRVRSVLCTPILRRGEILGVLYLENNLTSQAFTQERLSILQVIASQAAISIHNAQLYEGLEKRVAQRTADLAFKNRQIASMLDNMDQGVFTIDETLTVQPEYSRHLEQILETTDILGKNCIELLFTGADLRPDTVNTVATALRFILGVELWMAEANASHLVSEMQKLGSDGQPRFFEISWNLVCNDAEVVERVLVIVRDVTLLRRLNEAAHEKAREVDIIAQGLECGLDALYDFCAACAPSLGENRALLSTGAPLSPQSVAASFRNLHTLKGNARLLGLSHLVDALHAAEEAYDMLRQNPETIVDYSALRRQVDTVGALVEHYEDVCRRKLGQLVKKSDRRAERALQEIQALVANGTPISGAALLSGIRESLGRLEGASLGDVVDETTRLLPSLAAELGKSTPSVHLHGAEAQLVPEWISVMKDIFVQCFRNSLYHGIESPETRQAAGKSPEGQINVQALRGARALKLQISDDGSGLALGVLRQRASNTWLADEALADLIFQPGMSTADEVGQVAGRGVGLDIVRSRLRERGGDAYVRFTSPESAGSRPFALVIELPAHAVLGRFHDSPGGLAPEAAE